MATTSPVPHPLAQLTPDEFIRARDIILKLHGANSTLYFKSIYLEEPKRAELLPFLAAEHAGTLSDESPRPARQALVEYDIVGTEFHQFTRTVVDLMTGEITSKEQIERSSLPYYTA